MNRGERRRLYLRLAGVLVSVVVLAGCVLVIRFLNPPESRRAGEFDGRTWIQSKDDGPLLLVNGITGVVEGQSGNQPVPRSTVLGSSATYSLIEWGGSTHVVSNTTLVSEDVAGSPGADISLSGSTLWSSEVIAGRLTLRTRPVFKGSGWVDVDTGSVPDRVDDVTYPEVDGSGRLHLLVGSDGRRYHVSVDAMGEIEVVEVGDGSWIVVVDGLAAVIDLPQAMAAPVVVVGSPDWLADPLSNDVANESDKYAVWYDETWYLDGNILKVDDRMSTYELGVRPVLYEDGGRLWGVGSDRAVSIGRRADDVLVVELPDAIDFCVGDCSRESLKSEASTSSTSSTTPPSTSPGATTTVVSVPPPVSVPPVAETTTTLATRVDSTTTTVPDQSADTNVPDSTNLDLSGFTTVPSTVESVPVETSPGDQTTPGVPKFTVRFDPNSSELAFGYEPNGCSEAADVTWRIITADSARNETITTSGAPSLPVSSNSEILRLIVYATAICGDVAREMTPYVWERSGNSLVINEREVTTNGLEATIALTGVFFNGWALASDPGSSVSWNVTCDEGVAFDYTQSFDAVYNRFIISGVAASDTHCSVTLVVSISRNGGSSESKTADAEFTVASTLPVTTQPVTEESTTTTVDPSGTTTIVADPNATTVPPSPPTSSP